VRAAEQLGGKPVAEPSPTDNPSRTIAVIYISRTIIRPKMSALDDA